MENLNKKDRDFIHGESFTWGVMVRDHTTMAITVRKQDGSIVKKVEKRPSLLNKDRFFNLPIIGGIIGFLEGSTNQFRAEQYSAKIIGKQNTSNWNFFKKKFGDKIDKALPYLTVLSIIVTGIAIYFILPTLVVFLIKNIIKHTLFLNLIEILIRFLVFLSIFYVISKTDNTKKSALYHGAEHKAIFCYKNGEELTIENARKYPIYNPSCGTSLFITVIIISIPFFLLMNYENLLHRIVLILLLLPILIGISFDLITWTGKSQSKIAKILSLPGLYLQKLNAMEPDDKHLEIALISFKNVLSCKNIKK